MEHSEEQRNRTALTVYIDADLEELIPGYLNNRRIDLENIEASLLKDDYEAIRYIGHSMKGSGGGYGFDAISTYGAALEQGARTRDSHQIREAAQQLKAYLDEVVIVYEDV